MNEPAQVGVLAVIVPERLFIGVVLQVVGFHAHIRALQRTLEQTPEVLQAVGVNSATDVRFGVVDELVNVFVQAFVRFQGIGVDLGTGFDVFPYLSLHMRLAPGRYNLDAGFPVTL